MKHTGTLIRMDQGEMREGETTQIGAWSIKWVRDDSPTGEGLQMSKAQGSQCLIKAFSWPGALSVSSRLITLMTQQGAFVIIFLPRIKLRIIVFNDLSKFAHYEKADVDSDPNFLAPET